MIKGISNCNKKNTSSIEQNLELPSEIKTNAERPVLLNVEIRNCIANMKLKPSLF